MGQAITTHERLRREASKLFARRGYGGTSMSEIASRVGVRKASLYNYYASKEDLLFDLLERGLASWSEACQVEFEESVEIEAYLAEIFRAAVAFTERNPQTVAVIRTAATQIGGELGRRSREVLDRQGSEFLRHLETVFAEALRRGDATDAEPADLALFWGALLDGVLTNQVFQTHMGEALRERLDEIWALFWRGVSGRRPKRSLES